MLGSTLRSRPASGQVFTCAPRPTWRWRAFVSARESRFVGRECGIRFQLATNSAAEPPTGYDDGSKEAVRNLRNAGAGAGAGRRWKGAAARSLVRLTIRR